MTLVKTREGEFFKFILLINNIIQGVEFPGASLEIKLKWKVNHWKNLKSAEENYDSSSFLQTYVGMAPWNSTTGKMLKPLIIMSVLQNKWLSISYQWTYNSFEYII